VSPAEILALLGLSQLKRGVFAADSLQEQQTIAGC
jgi:hypothetical protein